MTSKGENVMAGSAMFSKQLADAYQLPVQVKQTFIDNALTREILAELPADVAGALVEGFLSGQPLTGESGRNVVEYFQSNSVTIPQVTEYPGTFAMLESMYGFQQTELPIDRYFARNLHGGISLEARFNAVNLHAAEHIRDILAKQDECLVLDLGSGPGRNCIAMTLENPDFAARVQFHCIDTDPAAIAYGRKLVIEHGLQNVHFVDKSMIRLHRRYRQSADYGLMIGVLCGLTTEERSDLLRIVKPYFKQGARLVGAGLLDKVLEADLFCAYILKETTGWVLQHEPIGAIGQAFTLAGYGYEGFFQEEPTKCYEIGIGLA